MATAEALEVQSTVESMPVIMPVTDMVIANMRDQFSGLKADDSKGYEEVRKAISTCRTARTNIEDKRKELKADALAWGRKVDAEAKRLTTMIEEIEDPLKAEKQRIDDEKERVKREKQEAERLKREAELKAQQELQEAQARKLREAEEARLKAERGKLEAERAEFERQRKEQAAKDAEAKRLAEEKEQARLNEIKRQQEAEREKLRLEQEKLDAEKRALQAERDRIAAEEKAKADALRAEQEAKERAEEQARLEQLRIEREEAARRRAEAMRPDVEKINAFGPSIRSWCTAMPQVTSSEAKDFVTNAVEVLQTMAVHFEEYRA